MGYNLVGGLEHFFSHILGISSCQLTNSYFSEGLKPPTSNSCLSWEHQLKLNYDDDDDMVWSENEGFASYGHGNDD
jgi:hypothetical protein